MDGWRPKSGCKATSSAKKIWRRATKDWIGRSIAAASGRRCAAKYSHISYVISDMEYEILSSSVEQFQILFRRGRRDSSRFQILLDVRDIAHPDERDGDSRGRARELNRALRVRAQSSQRGADNRRQSRRKARLENRGARHDRDAESRRG